MKPFACATVLILFSVIQVCPLDAAENDHEACMAASGGVTVAMLDCLSGASDRAQAALDAALDEYRSRLTSEEASAVWEAQRDWQLYRQSTCHAEGLLWADGSFAAVAQADCWLELTRERLDWLKAVVAEPV